MNTELLEALNVLEKETPQVNIKNLMKQYGFTLECNGSTLSGLCRNCKEEQG